jgi:citrate synthase
MEPPETDFTHRWRTSTGRNADMSEQTAGVGYRTGIGASEADSIMLLGHDLATELLGSISFGELAYWLLVNRRPTAGQREMFEAVLVALADHGFTPTAIAARVTLLSAPESIQGALAAGLLGGGSRFLGVTEDAALFLESVLSSLNATPAGDADWDAAAIDALTELKAAGRLVPGLGHPVHKLGDPRTPVLFALAREHGQYGPHLALFEAIGRVHPRVLGRSLPLNGAGVCGAVLADIEIPLGVIRGVALLARCAGLLGHIAEEQRDPIAMDIYTAVDRNTEYRPASDA